VGAGATVGVRSILSVDSSFGSNDPNNPASAQAVRGRITGTNLTGNSNYLTGVTGQYLITGTNASDFLKTGVLGVVGDQTTTADSAVVAYLDGDGGLTSAVSAYGVSMKNSTPGSGFDYGLDLQWIDLGLTGMDVPFKVADIRFNNGVELVANVANTVSIDANIVLGALEVTNDALVNGDANLVGNLDVGGYANVVGNLDVGNLNIANGRANITGAADAIGGGATVGVRSILAVDSAFGSNDANDPASAQAIRGRVTGSNLSRTRNYVTGVTGQYLVTGTNNSEFINAGLLGVVGDQTTTANAAVVAYLDGDGGLTTAGAAYGVSMKNSTPGSGFDYGLDLQWIDLNLSGMDVPFKVADIRFNNGVTLVANTAGNININANVSATSFSGNGANLTDVAASQIFVSNSSASNIGTYYPIFTSSTGNGNVELDNFGSTIEFNPKDGILSFGQANVEVVTNGGGEVMNLDGNNNKIRMSVSGSANVMTISSIGVSLQLATYASNGARDTDIVSPVTGQVVFVTGSGMQVRGATQWNLIAGSGT
jgi:hypothetical protein